MEQEATATGHRWAAHASAGGAVDVLPEMMHLTESIVLRAMLGSDVQTLAETAREWSIVNEYIGENFWTLGIAARLPTPRNRRFHRAVAFLDRTIFGVLDERRRGGAGGDDLVSMLLSARDPETGEGMTDWQLRDEIMTIFLAGHETTALTVTWAWYLLAQHPAIRAAPREQSSTTCSADARLPTEDLERLPYTRMVVEETMRLYPPAWAFSRRALAAGSHWRLRAAGGVARVRRPVGDAPASEILGRSGRLRP